MQEVDSQELTKAWVMMLYHDLDKDKKNPLLFYQDFIEKICAHDEQIHKTLFLMMAEIRDKVRGKGQSLPFYYLAQEWAKTKPETTVDAFFWICQHGGCWKDIKRWAHYIQDNSIALLYLVQKTNDVLSDDTHLEPDKRSNIAKWIPREHTRDGKVLYDLLAVDWCQRTPQHYLLKNLNEPCLRRIRKQYRQVLSRMHKEQPVTHNNHSPLTSLNQQVAALIQQEGIPLEATENKIKKTLSWYIPNQQARNMMIVWVPSDDNESFARQVAVLMQAWHAMNTTPRFLMVCPNGVIQWVDMKTHPKATYAEWVHQLVSWKPKEETKERGWLDCLETIPLPKESVTAEKMTWLWVGDMQGWNKSIQYTLEQKQLLLPHMVYVDTASHSYHTMSTCITFPCRVVQPRCSMVAATGDGLTRAQWEQIVLRTQSSMARQSSCWEFLEGVMQPYEKMLKNQ